MNRIEQGGDHQFYKCKITQVQSYSFSKNSYYDTHGAESIER